MFIVTSYIMKVFGDFGNIAPEMELMNRLTNIPGKVELLPGTANAVTFNATKNEPQIKQCIHLEDKTKQWFLSIPFDGIDAGFNLKNNSAQVDLNEVAVDTCGIMEHAVKACNIGLGRIAVNCSMKVQAEKSEFISAFHNQLVIPAEFQKGNECTEWQVTSNSPVIFDLSEDWTESVNVICNTFRQSESIVVLLDINTTPYNMAPRFNESHLAMFNTKAIALLETAKTEFERKWNNVRC